VCVSALVGVNGLHKSILRRRGAERRGNPARRRRETHAHVSFDFAGEGCDNGGGGGIQGNNIRCHGEVVRACYKEGKVGPVREKWSLLLHVVTAPREKRGGRSRAITPGEIRTTHIIKYYANPRETTVVALTVGKQMLDIFACFSRRESTGIRKPVSFPNKNSVYYKRSTSTHRCNICIYSSSNDVLAYVFLSFSLDTQKGCDTPKLYKRIKVRRRAGGRTVSRRRDGRPRLQYRLRLAHAAAVGYTTPLRITRAGRFFFLYETLTIITY